jgi:hypothetical protein
MPILSASAEGGKFFVTSDGDRLHCQNGCTQMTKKGDGAIGI